MQTIIPQKWKLAFKVIPYVVMLVVLKYVAHILDWEFLSPTSLFTALISANIFLIGFLLAGVLTDYKEAEKLPTELAVSLESITDEALIIAKHHHPKKGKACVAHVHELTHSLLQWFHRQKRTKEVLESVAQLSDHFVGFEDVTQANFIARLKQEQTTIRKTIIRIDAIRDTSFNSAGYAISEIITFVLLIKLIFVKIDPYHEGALFGAFVSFVLVYMVLLIKDLDNPFGYYEQEKFGEEVSFKPLNDLRVRLETYLKA